MNKRNIVFILLIAVLFLIVGCDKTINNKEKNEKTKTSDVGVYRIDMREEIKHMHEIKRDKYEVLKEREIKAKILENTRYIKYDDTTIYSNEELSEKLKVVDSHSKVYLEKENKNTGVLTIKDDYYSKGRGYIKSNRVHENILDFIRRKYDGVDYEYEIPNNNYENNKRVKAKGIYLTLNTFIDDSKIDHLIKMTKETEINTFVIDVKNDAGTLLFKSEAAKKYNPSAYKSAYNKDISATLKKLKDNNIYAIARIVTFKSPKYAVENPTKAITYKGTNNVYKNRNGVAWASAFDRDLWDYNIEVAKEAADYGFNEIQFDYVRFPALSRSIKARLDFKNKLDENKTQAIHNFLKKAYGELSKKEVYVAADIFGWSASSISDEGIGQHWEALVTAVDYSCPMIYPSHYGGGIFGFKVPDAHPYGTVYASTKDAINRNQNVKNAATLRPWIQDFTARWVRGHINYGPNEVKAQIKALEDLGVEEYILWSPGNNYSWEALK